MKTNQNASVQTAGAGTPYVSALQAGAEPQPLDSTGTFAALQPRADLLKCAGAALPCCTTCSRQLAPVAPLYQRWVSATAGNTCDYYADVEKWGTIYGPIDEHVLAVLAENHTLKDAEVR